MRDWLVKKEDKSSSNAEQLLPLGLRESPPRKRSPTPRIETLWLTTRQNRGCWCCAGGACWSLMEVCPLELGRSCSLVHHRKAFHGGTVLLEVPCSKIPQGGGPGGSCWRPGDAGLCVLLSLEAREAAACTAGAGWALGSCVCCRR